MTYGNFVAIIIQVVPVGGLRGVCVCVSLCVRKTVTLFALVLVLSSTQVERIEKPPRTHDWLYIRPCWMDC